MLTCEWQSYMIDKASSASPAISIAKALKLSPGSPDIYCDMGYSLYLQRRSAEAEMNLRQAIALDSNTREPTTTWLWFWAKMAA